MRELAAALDEACAGRGAMPKSWDRRDSLRDTMVDEPARRSGRLRAPNIAVFAPTGTVLRDEPAWAESSDDFDDDLEPPPHQRWKLAGFLFGFAVACGGAALLAGWQPLLAWRQSRVWHTLHLPRAAEPTFAQPAARGPAIEPLPSPAPASPPPVTGEASPAPSAPATTGAGFSPPAAPVQAPPAPAAALPAAATPPAVAAPPAADTPAAASERRHHHHASHESVQLRGMVWSEKEQRLVPADSLGPPAGTPPAPARGALPPGDQPLPLSPSPSATP